MSNITDKKNICPEDRNLAGELPLLDYNPPDLLPLRRAYATMDYKIRIQYKHSENNLRPSTPFPKLTSKHIGKSGHNN